MLFLFFALARIVVNTELLIDLLLSLIYSRYGGANGPVKEKLKPLIVWLQEADSGSDDDEESD